MQIQLLKILLCGAFNTCFVPTSIVLVRTPPIWGWERVFRTNLQGNTFLLFWPPLSQLLTVFVWLCNLWVWWANRVTFAPLAWNRVHTLATGSVPLWSLQLRGKNFIDLYDNVCCLLYKINRFISYSCCVAEIANSWVLLLHVSVPTCLLQLKGRSYAFIHSIILLTCITS